LNGPEDLYPLSPIQEGVLFHSLYEPRSDVYFRQFSVTMFGALDVDAFMQAWQQVIKRHPILRTSFYWEDLEKPLQAVHKDAELPLEQHDWRHLGRLDQEEQLRSFLESNQTRGLDLSTPPLMRLAIIRLAEDEYRVIWTYHNLLLDGWSKSLIVQEVLAFYYAQCQDKSISVPRSRPYRDYIAWLRRQDLSQAETFWREMLAGFHAPTPLLRGLKDVNPLESAGYHEQKMRLPADLSEQLKTLAREQQLTLNTIVQGAWALVLSRYSGEDDVVFGVTVSGRPADLAGVESMVGPFINTLPLRVEIDWNAELLEWLRDLQARQLEIRQYEYSPLVQVQGWSEVPRGKALFESIFVFENYPFDPESGQRNDELQIVNAHSIEQTNYPLTAGAEPGPELLLHLSYDATRFAQQTVKQMLDHWANLLAGIAGDPKRRLEQLPFLTTEEQQKLLVQVNDTNTTYPSDKCLHELFEEQASRTPDEVAAIFAEEQVTYAQLNARANGLAHHLRGLGVGPDVLVGICMERSIEMLVALLSVLKAGGAYVPLDPDYPRDRLAFMLKDSGVMLLLTQQRLLARLPAHDARVLEVDARSQQITSVENPRSNVTADNLAYMIYTSGSSGKPKGVMISHRSVCNHLVWMQRAFPLGVKDRVPLKYSFSFDVCVLECFWPLLAGAGLVITRPGGHQDVDYLVQLMAEHKITSIDVVPTLLEALLENPKFATNTALRRITCGGEALPLELQQRFFTQTIAELHNMYGPTEATIGSTFWTCPRAAEHRTVSIGLPISNTQVYVLDAQQRLVPVGVPGELYIGGVGLARGYRNRPELTAASFIPNYFGTEPGARLYRTGDLARYLPDGNIEFLGRVDEQVKIHGFRIELGEIETTLKQHPGVQEAVVLAREVASAKRHVNTSIDQENVSELAAHLLPLETEKQERLLAEVEQLSDEEAEQLLNGKTSSVDAISRTTLTRKLPEFDVALHLKSDSFIMPPHEAQRNWTLQRALDEFVDDLEHWDRISKRFVPGSERARIQHEWGASAAHYDDSQLIIEGQQVMQDWERPLMQAMADVVTAGHGDVLEVGFGMGISATYIQEQGVRSHSIIECNDEVIEQFNKWKSRYPDRDIRVIRGKWQDVTGQLGQYDGVFFDTYPLSEAEFKEYVIDNITFAESFFPVAASCLRKGGVFSYYTNEIDSFSRRHQRLVLKHFESFTLSVVRPLFPPADCNYWWADSMVLIKAVK
jgi:amino acid adenylation domain-containing protein